MHKKLRSEDGLNIMFGWVLRWPRAGLKIMFGRRDSTAMAESWGPGPLPTSARDLHLRLRLSRLSICHSIELRGVRSQRSEVRGQRLDGSGQRMEGRRQLERA
jgi:hypothetical protein